MKFNISNNVKVKLTDSGRDIYRKYWAPYTSNNQPKEIDGWTTFQLWDLMAVFGEHLIVGAKIPFETEIEFEFEKKSYP